MDKNGVLFQSYKKFQVGRYKNGKIKYKFECLICDKTIQGQQQSIYRHCATKTHNLKKEMKNFLVLKKEPIAKNRKANVIELLNKNPTDKLITETYERIKVGKYKDGHQKFIYRCLVCKTDIVGKNSDFNRHLKRQIHKICATNAKDANQVQKSTDNVVTETYERVKVGEYHQRNRYKFKCLICNKTLYGITSDFNKHLKIHKNLIPVTKKKGTEVLESANTLQSKNVKKRIDYEQLNEKSENKLVTQLYRIEPFGTFNCGKIRYKLNCISCNKEYTSSDPNFRIHLKSKKHRNSLKNLV